MATVSVRLAMTRMIKGEDGKASIHKEARKVLITAGMLCETMRDKQYGRGRIARHPALKIKRSAGRSGQLPFAVLHFGATIFGTD